MKTQFKIEIQCTVCNDGVVFVKGDLAQRTSDWLIAHVTDCNGTWSVN